MSEAVRSSDCWQTVGLSGDGSCEKLKEVVHCRNCETFAAAGRRLLDRPPPEGYLDVWTRVLAEEKSAQHGNELAVLVFRLGQEWLALPARLLKQVTHPRAPHRIPHHSGAVAGMANVDGELHLCVSLQALLKIERPEAERQSDLAQRRLIVVGKEGDDWVFAVDEVWRVVSLDPSALQTPPVTLAKSLENYMRGVVELDGRRVAVLDEELLFGALKRSIR
ncbi:MAG: chemotaxis protein CheW [Planctomycetota bacterium]|nr:chemotaxis protein CheW [Planctomycetota bacterium]